MQRSIPSRPLTHEPRIKWLGVSTAPRTCTPDAATRVRHFRRNALTCTFAPVELFRKEYQEEPQPPPASGALTGRRATATPPRHAAAGSDRPAPRPRKRRPVARRVKGGLRPSLRLVPHLRADPGHDERPNESGPIRWAGDGCLPARMSATPAQTIRQDPLTSRDLSGILDT